MKKEDREHLREEWAMRLKEWEASGLRPVEYCRANNVNEGQFHFWIMCQFNPLPSKYVAF